MKLVVYSLKEAIMAFLQVRDIDDHLYSALKEIARADHRSISQEVIMILSKYCANPGEFRNSSTRDFLALAGAWSDERSADEIASDLRATRKNSRRFGADNAVFD